MSVRAAILSAAVVLMAPSNSAGSTLPPSPDNPAGQLGRDDPSSAQRGVREGRAVLECRVTAALSLENCRVLQEDPPGLGFGQAALKVTRLFRVRPGTPPGSLYRLPFRFKLSDAPSPSSAPP